MAANTTDRSASTQSKDCGGRKGSVSKGDSSNSSSDDSMIGDGLSVPLSRQNRAKAVLYPKAFPSSKEESNEEPNEATLKMVCPVEETVARPLTAARMMYPVAPQGHSVICQMFHFILG